MKTKSKKINIDMTTTTHRQNEPRTLKERFEEMNRNCDGAYGTGKFPPEVWKFIEQALKEEGCKQYDAGYRKGVRDEVECIEISGEHGVAVKKIRKEERSRVVRLVRELSAEGYTKEGLPHALEARLKTLKNK